PHHARRDRVDADALTPDLGGDTAHEADHARLGGGVGGAAVAAHGGDGGDADDGAGLALRHGGDGGLGGEEHGLEIHRHHAVPVLFRGLEHVLAGLDADIVVQHVEPAVPL